MRITQGMLSSNMLRNMSKSYESMGKYQDQLTTGKKISRPSDDPVVAMQGINYRSELTKIGQFQRNIGEVYNWMDSSDAALDKATKAMQRVRELTVQASNDTNGEQSRESIAKEIEQLAGHLRDIGNTQANGKYLFNGTDTLTAPMDARQATDPATGETGEVRLPVNSTPVTIEVSKGIPLQANVDGTKVFGGGNTDEDGRQLFDTLQQLSADLRNPGTHEEELNSYLESIDEHVNTIIDERADLGARMNRRDLVKDRLGTQEIIATRVLSNNEDAEMEKVITNLKTEESVLRAAMGAGARIIQPTLMDFLR
ncbi:flagellar hook-associated protein FlgL [Salimicrobium album]|uniref:Flagellar hook-associated protein 3 FlgL n=1 Tax=Salimicrobium album TaxID=50717 RepID=A0A1H3G2L8_9BACI|nr:flagellar hook-associated protein FlgL [Salimicrobium album]SDX97466.1 flagellar hook-associated protein 3 FlgL [Salimicrobium album]